VGRIALHIRVWKNGADILHDFFEHLGEDMYVPSHVHILPGSLQMPGDARDFEDEGVVQEV